MMMVPEYDVNFPSCLRHVFVLRLCCDVSAIRLYQEDRTNLAINSYTFQFISNIWRQFKWQQD